MEFTNKYNLPQPIVDAITNDSYDNGGADISASSLLNAPRIFALEKQHAGSLTEDVADSLPALLGTAVHDLLEKHDNTGITEKRLFMKREGWLVSGKFDRFVYTDTELQDYKTTRADAFAAKQREGFKEWEQQLNIYKRLMEENHLAVSSLAVVVILVDWSPMRKARSEDYPPHPIVRVPLPIWNPVEADQWINSRIRLFQAALKDLPLCTDEERWQRGNPYKVIKKGRKRAVKTFPTQAEAEMWVGAQSDYATMSIIHEPPAPIRCQNYCPVASVCEQWKTDPFNPDVMADIFLTEPTPENR